MLCYYHIYWCFFFFFLPVFFLFSFTSLYPPPFSVFLNFITEPFWFAPTCTHRSNVSLSLASSIIHFELIYNYFFSNDTYKSRLKTNQLKIARFAFASLFLNPFTCINLGQISSVTWEFNEQGRCTTFSNANNPLLKMAALGSCQELAICYLDLWRFISRNNFFFFALYQFSCYFYYGKKEWTQLYRWEAAC